jgi:hypothetical protein
LRRPSGKRASRVEADIPAVTATIHIDLNDCAWMRDGSRWDASNNLAAATPNIQRAEPFNECPKMIPACNRA